MKAKTLTLLAILFVVPIIMCSSVQAAVTFGTPIADKEVNVGEEATFTVDASGTGTLNYQWQKLAGFWAPFGWRFGFDIDGATTTNHTTPPAMSSDDGAQFRCLVSEDGANTVSSDAATLTVHVPPTIIWHPLDVTVNEGERGRFIVTAMGGTPPLDYQWQLDDHASGTVEFVDITGGISQIYYTDYTDYEDDNGDRYRCVISDAEGDSVTSNAATLTVRKAPEIYEVVVGDKYGQPKDQTVKVGYTALFNVVATGTEPLTYQWQKNGANIVGASSSSYITDPVTMADDGGLFRCYITNAAGFVYSDEALLSVQDVPVITLHPVSKTVTIGQMATFMVEAHDTVPLNYSWEFDDGGGFSVITGAISSSYTTEPSAHPDDNGKKFRCIVSNAVGSATSNAATLTVLVPPSSITITDTNNPADEGETNTFNVTAFGSPTLIYQWQENGVDISGATNIYYITPPLTFADNGKIYRCLVTNDAASAYSNEITQALNGEEPTITTHPQDQSVYDGAPVTFSVTATGTDPLSYKWRRDDGSGFGDIVGGVNSSYMIASVNKATDDGAVFRCVVSNDLGTTTSDDATLTVIPVPPSIASHPSDKTVNKDDTATFSVVATGTAPLSYRWEYDDGSGFTGVTTGSGKNSATYTTDQTVIGDNGKRFRCKVTNPYGSPAAISNEAILTVLAAPDITTHPLDQTVGEGYTATFAVVATGTPTLSYQWQKNGANISGATSAGYTTGVVSFADNGSKFRCVVTNLAGSATSTEATLTVSNVAPTITTQPSNQTVGDGYTATFTVAATGSPDLEYRWQKNGVDTGTTNESYTTAVVHLADNGFKFRCVVSNPYGSVTSTEATLTVLAVPTITTPPSDQEVGEGSTATFDVVATGTPPLNYQWQKNSANISGATSAGYTTGPVSFADNGSKFRCVVTNAAGSATSAEATLTVNSAPTITTHPSDQEVGEWSTATFTVAATGTPPFLYQWQINGIIIVGATSAGYTTGAVTLADNGLKFRCVVTGPYGSVTSNEATLIVSNIAPTITTPPSNQDVGEGYTVTFNVAATGTPPLNYQWQKNGANISGATSSYYTTGPVSFADNGSKFRCVVSNLYGYVASTEATLTVSNVAPTITTPPSDEEVGEGVTVTFTVVATGSPDLEYQWQKNGANISGATSAGYSIGSVAFADNGSRFRCVVSNDYGTVASTEATLTVLVAPTITTPPSDQEVSEGYTVTFNVAATGTPPLNYQWQKNGANISGATSAGYSIGPVTFADNGSRFRCIVTNAAGSATSAEATLTVLASPSIVTHPSDAVVNEGDSATFSVVATGTTPLNYQWQRNLVNISGATNVIYTTGVLTFADNGSRFRCVVTNLYGSVISSEATLTVGVGNVASFPFMEDFEGGGLENYWATNSTGAGRILVTNANGPAAGIYHLTMDSATGGTYSLNELVLTIDLAGHSGVMLNFYHKEFNDEDHIMPDTFIGSNVSDGVAISADGSVWHKVQGLTAVDGIGLDWVNYEVNLDTAIAAAGISYNNTFMIKFQQYGNNPIQTGWWWLNYYSDGFAFDDIALYQGIVDTDEDGLSDDMEDPPTWCTNSNDADTDDDGILDGIEDANHNGIVDAGETDPCNYDTDYDGVHDGTELGYTLPEVGPDTDLGYFQPDLDPTTTTNPLNPDTDGDGLYDGIEDANHNGAVDPGESDPTAAPAAIPFSDGFESRGLENYWTTHSTGAGRIQVTTVNGPAAGIYHLTMDTSTNGFYSLNEAVLNLDLSSYAGGSPGVTLRFLHKEFNDEDDVMPPAFIGSHLSDGVAISADGTNWHKVQGLTTADGISLTWMIFEVDLDAAVAAAGITYNSNFKIKFQQYGSYPINWGSAWGYFWYWFSPPSDGFAFDNIEVYLN